jgi:DNA-binding CsgD family transcriptional regulator
LAGLARANWPIGSRALADVFFPSGTDAETLVWFAHWQQASADAETAARLLTDFRPDLRPVLHCLTMPTLVLHRRRAVAVPFGAGQELASLIPDARFLPLDGDVHFPGYGDAESILQPVLEFLAEGTPVPTLPDGLTQREVEVLRLMPSGMSNRQIAEALAISINTVDRHVSNIYTKIGASNRAEAAAYAVRNGLA